VNPAERMAQSHRPSEPDPDNTGEGNRKMPEIEAPHKDSVSEFLSETIFEEILADAVKEGMRFLGESSRQAIYIYIEKKCGLKQEEHPKQLKIFHESLTGIFGIGADIIEQQIAKVLYGRLGLDYKEHEKWTIIEYVEEAKKRIMSSV
jgi:hypothetical protein